MGKNYQAELVACIGDPMNSNPTAVMEEAGFEELGLNWRCITVRVPEERLAEAITGFRAMGFRGLGVTAPHKQAIIPLLDELTPAASIIGAVNAVSNRNGYLIGDNTDGRGIVAALKAMGSSLVEKKVTFLGAGSHARAYAVECALAGAKQINIIACNDTDGMQLADLICNHTSALAVYIPWKEIVQVPDDTDILLNTTDIGCNPNSQEKPMIDYGCITEKMIVGDTVFDPEEPLFIQEAKRRGAMTISGVGMIVYQGALAFEFWTGKEAPVSVMWNALENELKELQG